MRKLISIILVFVFLLGGATATFNENMDVNDDAQASVDRPLMNHVKSFLNQYIPPLYDLITGIESFLAG
jgi:4-hydroxybenzoate polyprenyltransferase